MSQEGKAFCWAWSIFYPSECVQWFLGFLDRVGNMLILIKFTVTPGTFFDVLKWNEAQWWFVVEDFYGTYTPPFYSRLQLIPIL